MRDDAKRERDKRHAANRPAYVAWYRTAAWRSKAKAQLIAQPRCAICLTLGKDARATIADHIRPHRGDHALFWHGRLQSLCKPCHDGIKQSLERGSRAACDETGMPTDPLHPWSAS